MTSQNAPPPIAASETPPPSTSASLQTRIYSVKDLTLNPMLAGSLTDFVNSVFWTSTAYPPTHWEVPDNRFETPTALLESLGPHGLVAVVYSDEEPVACACTSPWKGDLFPSERSAADLDMPLEVGWEFKAVATKKGFNKLGLAGRCIGALTKELAKGQHEPKLRLWIHVVDEVNGEYWRRRGWKEIRRTEMPAGRWGSKFGFWLVVMCMDVNAGERTEAGMRV